MDWKKYLFTGLSALALGLNEAYAEPVATSTFQSSPAAHADIPSEDQVFDENVTTPTNLLLRMYQQSPLLVLGAANHCNSKIYVDLKELLKKVGTDPHLKYIVIERAHDAAAFYRDLSLHPLHEVWKQNHFDSSSSRKNALCASPEWAYTVQNVMPFIQKLNRKRPPGNKLLVTAIDGISSNIPIDWPKYRGPYSSQRCDLSDQHDAFLYATSGSRENDSEDLFQKNIWQNLKPGEKAIVVYHGMHLIRSVTTCTSFLRGQDSWSTDLAKLTWFSQFLDGNPDATSRIVLFDELDQCGFNHGGAQLKFSTRQSSRHPDLDFGIELKPFTGIESEKGLAAFEPGAFIQTYHDGKSTSSASLPEMADAVIWSHDAMDNYAIYPKTSEQILPGYCGRD